MCFYIIHEICRRFLSKHFVIQIFLKNKKTKKCLDKQSIKHPLLQHTTFLIHLIYYEDNHTCTKNYINSTQSILQRTSPPKKDFSKYSFYCSDVMNYEDTQQLDNKLRKQKTKSKSWFLPPLYSNVHTPLYLQ